MLEVSFMLIILGVFLLGLNLLVINSNNKPKAIKKDKINFCILIPARYESKVIEGLLKSIKKQTVKVMMKDVYVIVESQLDETVNIANKYKASIFVRAKLNLQRKGYALDECIKSILKNKKHYDMYFIIDADNVLDSNFILEMIKFYKKGYDITTGYRNCKNASNVVSASSALTFFMLNTLINQSRIKYSGNVIISGTGFYIKGELIEKWQGFPFHSLTEDYEITLYSILNSLKTFYNSKAIFYDEQPVSFKQTKMQRVRWIRGYIDTRKKYINKIKKGLFTCNNMGSRIAEIIGVHPYILIIMGLILYIINIIFNILKAMINNISITMLINKLGVILIMAYTIMSLCTLIIFIKENKQININNKMKIKTIFYYPLYLISYIPCAIKALVLKEVKWDIINHNVNDAIVEKD
ncbi:MAG: glycosyltransferase family 2 protein [Bacilli bacterium]